MVVVEHQEGLYRGDKTPLATVPLQDAARTAPSRAQAASSQAYPMHYANAGLNSRLPAALPRGAWRIRWQKPLGQHESPISLLRSADRILVRFANSWLLFDNEGRPAGRGEVGPGAIFLDASPGLFYVPTHADTLEGRRVADGSLLFQTSISHGSTFVFPLIARAGNRLMVVGTEIEQFSHTPQPATESTIEFKEFGKSFSVDETGMLNSVTRGGTLRVNSPALFAAVQGDVIHFAVPDAVASFSTDLQARSACSAKFTPRLMSVDEAGNAYLLVESGGRPSLWAVTPDCKRFINLPLEPRYGSLVAPPVIGYDHRIYLVSTSWAVAISPEGKIVWEREISGPAAGAGVTADDRLLVAAGDMVIAFHANGEPETLARFTGDKLITYPVLTAHQQILVASQQTLYCLESGQ